MMREFLRELQDSLCEVGVEYSKNAQVGDRTSGACLSMYETGVRLLVRCWPMCWIETIQVRLSSCLVRCSPMRLLQVGARLLRTRES